MVTIQIKKVSDFETRPELDGPRQTFNALEHLIASHHDTRGPGNRSGSFLIANTSLLKRGNLSARKFEECQKDDEGNAILETRVSVHPNVLIMYINLNEIGILEGRGSYEIRPDENGLWLQAQEVECYKNSDHEEAHAVKRSILRNYTVKGNFDWRNLMSTLMPDGTLYIAVNAKCHPGQLKFPVIGQDTTYSSLGCRRPDFPRSNQCHPFGSFTNAIGSVLSKCGNCGKNKSVGAQTGGSLTCLPSPGCGLSSTATQTSSLYLCVCDGDSMEMN